MPLYAIICHYMPLYAIICHYMPLYAIICHYMPLYAIICQLRPIYKRCDIYNIYMVVLICFYLFSYYNDTN